MRASAQTRYVVADLVRNPRRTLATMVGVILGVGLFCGVLFFVDGLSASMTQRAVAPLPIDMQRIVSERAAGALSLSQDLDPEPGTATQVMVALEISNQGQTAANEVTVRSIPGDGLAMVEGSAQLDARPLDAAGNPFALGPAMAGYNLGTLEPGQSHRLSYLIDVPDGMPVDSSSVASSFSTRESVSPIAANQPPAAGLDELAAGIAALPGIARAEPLSIAELGSDTIRSRGTTANGRTKIFGFSASYADNDASVDVIVGSLGEDGTVLSAEAAQVLGVTTGDIVSVDLPDGSSLELIVTGIADLSQARALFSSRRGGDLETFVYAANAVVVSPALFAETVFPAFERAAAAGGGRLKSPPIREVDITLERNRLDSDPATAARETDKIASTVMAVAEHQDYLLDNITNTLHVAAADASVAKRLFVFLGLPGALLAAMLAAYAGNVLAEAQRREQATLRVRGANRRDLLRMLGARTALLTATGSLLGLTAGYVAAASILGRTSLDRAGVRGLVTSAGIGTLGGFAATGAALFITGRRSIDTEINDDRARLRTRPPLWLRGRLDVVGTAIVVVGTAWALAAHAFDGASGSVYFGRGVQLELGLLVLPVAVWVAGTLAAARLIGGTLHRSRPPSAPSLGRPGPALLRRSISRRPWAITNAAILTSLVVALATSLAAFTASYDHAKIADARYANGADLRITPSPAETGSSAVTDPTTLQTPTIETVTPVIYALSNVILRSDRTSDPANLAALDPHGFRLVAPIDRMLGDRLELLDAPGGVLLSAETAAFLQTSRGDTVHALLARATPDQAEVELVIVDVYERLPGFPDGVDAVMRLDAHQAAIPAKTPDFFLANASGSDDAALAAAAAELVSGPGAVHDLHIVTRATTLARDQSSLAALNISGLVDLDSVFALAMATVAVAIFVFGLLLQRRREYVMLRAQGLDARTISFLIGAEAATVAVAGAIVGLGIGLVMGWYFVAVLRPLFVLDPVYTVSASTLALAPSLVLAATVVAAAAGSYLVGRLQPTELLRDE